MSYFDIDSLMKEVKNETANFGMILFREKSLLYRCNYYRKIGKIDYQSLCYTTDYNHYNFPRANLALSFDSYHFNLQKRIEN